ncbi:MAG: UvrD-helicase domain-containing protein, partial [Oligoflexia bacterium]|nr:UvrD-helicase domain-containing protein [Oligoflexia bacterium]
MTEHTAAGHSHLQNLNSPQLEAVLHHTGPILVLAGAGSGKTRVLTNRVANLVLQHGVRPDQILAVTFTNKAAEEMRARLSALLGDASKRLWISTFHSAALRMLRRHAHVLGYAAEFAVYDEQDTKSVLKQVMRSLNIDEKRFPPQLFSRYIDQCKNAFVLPQTALSHARDFAAKQQAEVYELYQRELMRANAMDFGDLLVNAVLLLKRFPDILRMYREHIHFVLVDEFQDTNTVQYMFIRYISEPRRNLLVVGDDDQSIYAFRGATIKNILEFEKDFPETKVIKLEQNYRSSGNILTAAHAVIEKNSARKAKKLWTDQGPGTPIMLYNAPDEGAEARFIATQITAQHRAGLGYSKFAVFYRTNAQSRALEEAFIANKIPYKIYGGLRFYERKEIKDIIGYLKLLANESDNQALLRVINTPPRGIGAQTVQGLEDLANAKQISLMAVVRSGEVANKGVLAFLALIDDLRAKADKLPLGELISDVIKLSEYGPRLQAMKDPAAQSRVENLQELVAIGRTMENAAPTPRETLQVFLDRVSLTASADLPQESDTPADKNESIAMMTLHLAKGLEFPVVFLTGMEEGLIPHYRSIPDPVALEEERRLCYVGITRAMQKLFITRAQSRGMFSAGDGFGYTGTLREVSRFMRDVPPETLESTSDDFFSESVRFEAEEDNDSYGERSYNQAWKSENARGKSSTWNGNKQKGQGWRNYQSRPKKQALDELPALPKLVKPADQ